MNELNPSDRRLGMSPDERATIIERLRKWKDKPYRIHHQTIGILVQADGRMEQSALVQAVGHTTRSANPYGIVRSLMTTKGKNHGRVFVCTDGVLHFHPDILDEVMRHRWTVGDREKRRRDFAQASVARERLSGSVRPHWRYHGRD
jgi:hypothetical protein